MQNYNNLDSHLPTATKITCDVIINQTSENVNDIKPKCLTTEESL